MTKDDRGHHPGDGHGDKDPRQPRHGAGAIDQRPFTEFFRELEKFLIIIRVQNGTVKAGEREDRRGNLGVGPIAPHSREALNLAPDLSILLSSGSPPRAQSTVIPAKARRGSTRPLSRDRSRTPCVFRRAHPLLFTQAAGGGCAKFNSIF
jgi:hypothetical protein